MEVEEIEVYIEKDGQVRIEVRCVKGMRCLDITAPVEEALGGETVSRELTYEAYEEPRVEEEPKKQQLRDGQ